MFRNVCRSACEVPLFWSDLSETRIFITDFRKIFKFQISWKSAHWETGRVVTCGQTHRRTDMTKRIVALHNFMNAPKNATTFHISTDADNPQTSRCALIPQHSLLTCSWRLKSATYFDGRELSILSRPSDTLTNEIRKPEVLGMWLGELHVRWGADSVCNLTIWRPTTTTVVVPHR